MPHYEETYPTINPPYRTYYYKKPYTTEIDPFTQHANHEPATEKLHKGTHPIKNISSKICT